MLNASTEILQAFIDRFNGRMDNILQIFDLNSTFEFLNTDPTQTMPTQEALILMDQEVDSLTYRPNSLSIDDQQGFSIFFTTFEGSLTMKSNTQRAYKLSFMVEGKVTETDQTTQEPKQTIVTVKAAKMHIE